MAIIGLVSSTHFALDGSLYPRVYTVYPRGANDARLSAAGAFGVYADACAGLNLNNAITAPIPTRMGACVNSVVGGKLRTTATNALHLSGTCTGTVVLSDIVLQGGPVTSTATGVTYPVTGSAAWTPGDVVAGTTVSTTVAVPNAGHGDYVQGSFSLDLQGCTINATPRCLRATSL